MADGGALVVADAENRQQGHLPAGVAGAQAEVEILTVQAEAVVERTDGLPDLTAEGERGAGDPADRQRSGPWPGLP